MHMQSAARDPPPRHRPKCLRGKVGGEEKIITANGATQQERPGVADVQHQFREEPSALLKKAFFARTKCFDVAPTVKYGKKIAVLEDPRAVVRRRCCSCNVELLCGIYLNQLALHPFSL